MNWQSGMTLLGIVLTHQYSPPEQQGLFSPVDSGQFRPYSLLFLRFSPKWEPLAVGQSKWKLQFVSANSFSQVPENTASLLSEDIEADRLHIEYARGLGKKWQVSARGGIEDLSGGFMDPIINWYHRTFLNLVDKRSVTPFGRHIVNSAAGGPFSGGFGPTDIDFELDSYAIPRVMLGFGIKAPLADPGKLLGSGRPDAGVTMEYAIPAPPHWGFLLQGAIVAQSQAVGLVGARPLVWQLAATATLRQNSKDSWTVQWERENSALNTGVPQSDQIHSSLTVGYTRSLPKDRAISAFFVEDIDLLNPNFPTGANVGPDFVFGLEYSWKGQ